MITELEELPKHLSTLKPENWNKLFTLLPKIEATKEFREPGIVWRGKKFYTPHIDTPEVVFEFLEIVYKIGIVVDFDWMYWKKGKNILNSPTKLEMDFTKLHALTLCKLITCIVRADRFNEGILVQNFQCGVIPKIIKALQLKFPE